MERYADAGLLRRVVRQATTSRPLAWLSARVLHRFDRLVQRASGGRATFSGWVSGLPVVLLTTTGARTGLPRTTPVLGIPDGDGFVVIASNFGKQQHPAWYHNLVADPAVTLTVDGVTTAFEARRLTGRERAEHFGTALELNPGWLRYRNWAGDREIPVIALRPTGRVGAEHGAQRQR